MAELLLPRPQAVDAGERDSFLPDWGTLWVAHATVNSLVTVYMWVTITRLSTLYVFSYVYTCMCVFVDR